MSDRPSRERFTSGGAIVGLLLASAVCTGFILLATVPVLRPWVLLAWTLGAVMLWRAREGRG